MKSNTQLYQLLLFWRMMTRAPNTKVIFEGYTGMFITTFFQRIRWSSADETNDNDISKQHKNAYAELAIMVSIFSNGVTSAGYDLETCIKRVRFAHSKFYNCGVYIDDHTDIVSYKTCFQPHGQINSLEDIGHKLPGIQRRPAIHEMHPAYFDKVAIAIWHTCCSNSGNSFGRGVYIPKTASLNIWFPCPCTRRTESLRNARTHQPSI